MGGFALNAAATARRGLPALPGAVSFPFKPILFLFVYLLGKFLFLFLTLAVPLAAKQ